MEGGFGFGHGNPLGLGGFGRGNPPPFNFGQNPIPPFNFGQNPIPPFNFAQNHIPPPFGFGHPIHPPFGFGHHIPPPVGDFGQHPNPPPFGVGGNHTFEAHSSLPSADFDSDQLQHETPHALTITDYSREPSSRGVKVLKTPYEGGYCLSVTANEKFRHLSFEELRFIDSGVKQVFPTKEQAKKSPTQEPKAAVIIICKGDVHIPADDLEENSGESCEPFATANSFCDPESRGYSQRFEDGFLASHVKGEDGTEKSFDQLRFESTHNELIAKKNPKKKITKKKEVEVIFHPKASQLFNMNRKATATEHDELSMVNANLEDDICNESVW